MKCRKMLLMSAALCFCLNFALGGEPQTQKFSGETVPANWKVSGDVSIDKTMTDRAGAAGGVLKIAPGAKAEWSFAESDGSGKVDVWVYDECLAPANPKKKDVGPVWGVKKSDGTMFVMGPLYAHYLTGDKTYAASCHKSGANKVQVVGGVRYLGAKRQKKWNKYTFVMDPEKGLDLLVNDKSVNRGARPRFIWNDFKDMTGVSGVVLIGDRTAGGKQNLFVDEVVAQATGPMKAKPVAPPPPPPVVPDKDPAEKKCPQLLKSVRGVHPRLVISKDQLPKLRKFAKNDPMGKHFFSQLMSYYGASLTVPSEPNFLTNATDGQRQGLWRMPTVGMHYLITGDKKSLDAGVAFLKMLEKLPNWETTNELDSGMSKANIAIGAALLFDWLYNDLEPEFRETFRKKLIAQARAQYHGGHLMKNPGRHYWQQDPANNHRWHRNAGMILSLLAAAEGDKPEENWILQRAFEELAFVVKWLPSDGTCHEGPGYIVFGSAHLTLTCQAADRCWGTDYLKNNYFRNMPLFRLHTLTPGFEADMTFGDSGGLGSYNNFFYKCTAEFKEKNAQNGIVTFQKTAENAFWLGWMSLLWFDPDLNGGSLEKLAKNAFFPDLGLACMRDSWKANGVAALFKCGPFGGYDLNRYRHDGGKTNYINVAHDDPDANSFIIARGKTLLAETDRYAKHKQSSNHNTILINGMGQMADGRPEGGQWSQPSTRGKMTEMGVITAYQDNGDVVVVEGEASGSYLAAKRGGKSRPAIDRFRRDFIWVKGKYILVIDDIRSPEAVDITWLMQGKDLSPVKGNAGAKQLSFTLEADGKQCPFTVEALTPWTAAPIGESTANNKSGPLGHKQLQAAINAKEQKVVSIFDPWGTDVKFTVKPSGAGLTVTVTGKGVKDAWTWKPGAGTFDANTLTGKGGGLNVSITAQNAKPPKHVR